MAKKGGVFLKLSIGMMVKNEEANLTRCLESLKPLMRDVESELIIVDTGSTDKTVEIAKAYTDKVYFHPWENDYGKMRNHTLSYAKGQWFMFIDADEEVVSHRAIVKFLRSKESQKYNSATVEIKSFYNTEDEDKFSLLTVTRIFKRTKDFRFEGAIHEQGNIIMPFYITEALLNHYGYVSDDNDLKERKLNMYEPILLEELKEDPDNIYYWFQLSRTYASYKDKKSALSPAVKSYEIIIKNKLEKLDYLYVYANLALQYLLNDMYDEAISIAEEGLGVEKAIPDLWYWKAAAHGAKNQSEEAVESYEKYLHYTAKYEREDNIDVRVVNYTFSYKEEAYLELCRLKAGSEKFDEALDYLLRIKSQSMIKRKAGPIASITLKLKKWNVLEDFYKEIREARDPELEKHFYKTLEEYALQINGEKVRLYEIFAKEKTEYGLLNTLRLLEGADVIDAEILTRIGRLDLNCLDSYYGDVLYFLVKAKRPLETANLDIYEENIEKLFQYLDVKYKDLSSVYREYMKKYTESTTPESSRAIRIMARKAVFVNSLAEPEYKKVLDRYVEEGIDSLYQVYSREILNEKKSHLLKSREEVFFLYMSLAEDVKNIDVKRYLGYLKKCLEVLPEAKRAIEIKTKDVSKVINTEQAAPLSEMEIYAGKVKRNIRLLIGQGNLEEAAQFISTIDEILPGDEDIKKFKEELAAIKGKV
jgi:glycosyltransferase involved in cell wall biosynthesis